jgi:hypothetical protein
MTDTDDPARADSAAAEKPASRPDDSEENDADDTDGTDGTEDDERVLRSERADQDHLRGVEDGCGCAEVWEHLSEQRERDGGSRENRKEERTPATGDG